MAPHEERVVAEEKDLEDKIAKLDAFIKGDIFAALPAIERIALREQRGFMVGYFNVLRERISRFKIVVADLTRE